MFEDQRQLGKILDHRDDDAAELGGEDHGFNVAVILEPVADDDALGISFGHGHHGKQLRLRTDFKAKTELRAVAVHLFDYEALLIDLDREHRGVAILVVVLRDRIGERVVQVAQAVGENVGEPHHEWRAQIARLQAFDHFEEIDLAFRERVGPHHHVAGRIDAKVSGTPSLHLVQLERILDLPGLARRGLLDGVIHDYRLHLGRARKSCAHDSKMWREVNYEPLSALASRRNRPPGVADPFAPGTRIQARA